MTTPDTPPDTGSQASALPPTAFDSDRGRKAAEARWAKVRAKREEAARGTGESAAGMPGTMPGEDGEGLDEFGLLARSTLAAIAGDSAQPAAARVAAARALAERASEAEHGGRTLSPAHEAELRAWVGRRAPIELGPVGQEEETGALARI